jgi:ankyrin repeat protein
LENPIRRSASPLDETDIAAAEAEIGLRLPDAYRAFLLEHNGGVARRTTFFHTNKKGASVETWLGWIYCIGQRGKLDPVDLDLITAYNQRPAGLPVGMLPVAHAWFAGNSGSVCVACEGADAGMVFFRPNVDPEKTTIYPVGARWDRFLEKLEYSDEKSKKKWKHFIQDGDADGLRGLLEQSEKWRNNHLLRSDMEADAVDEGHWPIVELLVEQGWSASELFTRAIGSRRFELAHRILSTGKVSPRTIQESLTDSDSLLWYMPDFAQLLIEQGADIDHQNSTGESPLHKAVESRSAEGMRLLIVQGANPTLKNDDGRTPAALARRLEEPALLPMLREAETAWEARPVPDPSTLKVSEFDLHGVVMTKAGPVLSLADIAAFEREAGLALPPEYRGFLLRSNGGTPEPNRCELPGAGQQGPDDEETYDRGEPAVRFSPLFPVERPGEKGPPQLPTFDPSNVNPMEMYRFIAEAQANQPVPSVQEVHADLRQTGNPRRMLPIGLIENYGLEGGTLLISCQGRDRGRIYYRDGCLEMDSEGADFVVESLDALFRKLGEARARPVTPNDQLAQAVKTGDIREVRDALARGADPMKPGRDGMRPIDEALTEGHDEVALAMVEAGADLDQVFPQALQCGRLDLARKLLEHGKPSKKALREGFCTQGIFADSSLVKLLLDRGASASKGPPNMRGWVPLHFAAQAGNLESIKLLLNAGADPNAQAPGGQTPLVLAAERLSRLQSASVIVFLLGRGARVNVPDMQGETALHKAARAGHLESAKMLIEAGEDLHARHGLTIPGMSKDVQEKMAAQGPQIMQQMLAMFGGNLTPDPDADAPPPPDTSTPLGEKLAQAADLLQQRMAGLAGRMPEIRERMRDMAEGGFNKGRSAAHSAGDTPEGRAILPELERHAAMVKKPRG